MTGRDSLARGVAPAQPGTLHARSATDGIEVAPLPGLTVRFGRGPGDEGAGGDVELHVGRRDQGVSRRHGELTCLDGGWTLRNTGQQALRLPHGRLLPPGSDRLRLPPGYTPVFVKGSGFREHLVELYVVRPEPVSRPGGAEGGTAAAPPAWALSDDERLVLVVLGQRYLRHEPDPRPLPYRQAAEVLAFLRPGERWSAAEVARRVEAVRRRLARDVAYPSAARDAAAPDPRGCGPDHRLLTDLVAATALVPPDLGLLDGSIEG
ncbi:FHA domain-containing protein [Streptomyces sp. WMMC500]|uniref:FHA domain-containing protein n=1 Tax=Streptomyces sp. WMMC500 TaxID=3015154 RepID=UPI00248C5BF7|nr:FHA domain-containing protein [Streptomyces sp. WMMC500]WBB61496.1 FHA domain-containing protein [Streptomyces sp. WMMC500]